MNTKNKDFSHLLKPEHFGKWIALSEDYSRILAFSETLKALKGRFSEKNVVYTRILEPTNLYAF